MNRQVVGVALVSIVSVFAGGCTSQSSAGDEAAVREVLSKFLRDFENGDLAAMEAAFAEDAMLLKRPLFVKDEQAILVGFRASEAELQEKLT